MKKVLVILACTIVVSHGYVSVARAATDAFLLIQGLKGDSKNAGRTDWTNIRSFSLAHGLPSALGTTPTTVAKGALFLPLAVTKFTDSISPALAFAAASGQAFPTAVVELVTASASVQVVFLRLELFDVRIAAHSVSGNTQVDIPTEELKLSYNRIRWTAFKIGPDGRQSGPPFIGAWDLVNNKSF